MGSYIRLGDGVKKGFEQDMASALTSLGYAAMLDAYKKRTFKHRTRNLRDSYASAVYYNGKLIKTSVKYLRGSVSFKKDYITGKTGRETVDDYLTSHNFGEKKNEFVLVVIAAMYYAGILEAGGMKRLTYKDKDGNKKTKKVALKRGPGDRYIVISPARTFIDKHYMEYVGKVYDKYGIKEKPTARVIKGENIKYEKR